MHCFSNLVATTAVAVSVAFTPTPTWAAVAPTAAAESAETPDALSAAAVEAFRAGEYDKAIELFERAYTLDPQPNYLFNIGRVYEEKADLSKAVANYQEFVKQPGVDIEAREAATERLKVLRRTLAELEDDEEPTGPVVEPGVDAPTPAEQTAAAKKRKMRLAGYSLLGVGGGTLVIGAVFGGLAIGKSNDAKDAAFVDDKLALRQEAQGRAKVGDGLLITGGVLAAVGLVLVLATLGKGKGKSKSKSRKASAATNRRSERTTWQPLVAPSLGRTSAGLSFAGRF